MASTNKHPGKCYICGMTMSPGDGYVVKHGSGWRLWCIWCDVKKVNKRDVNALGNQ